MKKFSTLLLVLALVALAAGPALALNSTGISTNWTAGSAASECAAVGTFQYAWKFNTADGEGAPAKSETASFPDGHSNTLTISGVVLNEDGETSQFNWSSAPNGIGAVIVKAGTGALVYYYDPQVKSGSGLVGYEGKGVSHVTFCWDRDPVESQWCSPGYWRQPKHLSSWPATIKPTDLFKTYFNYSPARSKLGVTKGAPTHPTLMQVLQFPQYYGGDAFNKVGDLLSTAHPGVNFSGVRTPNSCPLN
jgi:hypothetical protein